MFDHLVQHRAKPRKRIPVHHHLSVLAMMVIAVVSVSAVMVDIFTVRAVEKQVVPAVSVTLVDTGVPHTLVRRSGKLPMGSLRFVVTGAPVYLNQISFAADGVYDPAVLIGFETTVDSSQAGYPIPPDEQGVVTVPLAIAMSPGVHTIVLQAVTSGIGFTSGTTIGIHFGEHAIQISDTRGSGIVASFALPHVTGLVSITGQGTIHAFRKPLANKLTKQIGLYMDGEEAWLREIRFIATTAADNTRVDIFSGEKFVTTASFTNHEAVAAIPATALRLLQGKNTTLDFKLAAGIHSVVVSQVTADGVFSGLPLVMTAPVTIDP